MSGQLRVSIDWQKTMERGDMATVLVVEDEPNIRKLVSVNLVSRGYKVLEATNMPQALDHLVTTWPDLMILNIKLSEVTGWDLLKRIGSDPNMAVGFPVLVMTASIMEAQIDHDRFPYIVDVLIKPFSSIRLMTAIERALYPPTSR